MSVRRVCLCVCAVCLCVVCVCGVHAQATYVFACLLACVSCACVRGNDAKFFSGMCVCGVRVQTTYIYDTLATRQLNSHMCECDQIWGGRALCVFAYAAGNFVCLGYRFAACCGCGNHNSHQGAPHVSMCVCVCAHNGDVVCVFDVS